MTIDNTVHEIPLIEIRPAPWNPPSRLKPERVKDLADSIRVEGQQSPALLRPVEAEEPIRYELVWGHRRFAALQLLAGQTYEDFAKYADFGQVVLKAFIREMSEEDAMISSGIENLQREGFSDIEEAEFFQTCGERYGQEAVKILAEKLSVSDRYVRKRLRFLELPDQALDLWRTGVFHAGHLEQLLRLGDNDRISAFLEEIDEDGVLKDLPVWRLQDLVDKHALSLHSGHFDKNDCKACRKNTDVQRRLFGSAKEKTKCLDAACFQAKEQAWLDLYWPDCKENKWGTQAAVICNDYKNYNSFSLNWGTKPTEKCRTCPQFSTIMHLGGYEKDRKFRAWHEMVCLGKAQCYAAAGRQTKQKEKEKNKNSGAGVPAGASSDAPRVAWHGEHFRQEFYKQEIPRLIADLPLDNPRRLQLTLAGLVYSCDELHQWFCDKFGLTLPKPDYRDFGSASFPVLLNLVRQVTSSQAEIYLPEVLSKIALHTGYGNGNWNCRLTFIDSDRQALAEFLDIDWSRYQITAEYLEKKTKAEIIAFITRDSGLAAESAFLEYCQAQGFPTLEKLAQAKKPILVDLVLNCGVDLYGRLPKEIADRPQLNL
ncbi:MAG: ParB/RepB/Spo0J family partition protein [Deltaproteobacteria bacterium]|nr:MAG: ParB/RepB/Spo0J family partition protein [Deltaproteobacteria bacterium]